MEFKKKKKKNIRIFGMDSGCSIKFPDLFRQLSKVGRPRFLLCTAEVGYSLAHLVQSRAPCIR